MWLFYVTFKEHWKTYQSFHKNIKEHNSNVVGNSSRTPISILEWYLKVNVTLKTREIAAEIV